MKHIIEYRESNGDLYPSIILLPCEPIAPEIKKLVYDYLTNKDFLEWTTFGVGLVDSFTGKIMNDAWGRSFTDEEYRWQDDLPAYFVKYDVKLPNEFIQHVLNFYEAGGIVSPCESEEIPNSE